MAETSWSVALRALRGGAPGAAGAQGVGSGLQRAQAFMILATMLYRASHLAIGLVAVVQRHRDQPVQYAAVAAAVGLSVLVYGTALRRGWFTRRHVWADVVVCGCLLPFALWAWGGARESATLGWAMILGGSASAAVAVALDRVQVAAAVVLLAGTHVIGYQAVGASPAVVLGHLNSLLSSAVMAWVFWWYLRRQGRLLDDANARTLTAEAHRARYEERLEHHRALHDTVLATLTTLAAGGIDANAPEVRERCAREAAYLRRLVQQTSDALPRRQIGTALEEAVRAAEGLRLKVTARYHALPHVPPEVATALADAVAEALNNVRRHAGTGHAYLTAAVSHEGHEEGHGADHDAGPGAGSGGADTGPGGDGTGGGVVVTVVDRGRGLDPERYAPGFGLRRSVHDRMAEVGGRATVDGAPGEGVRVELRWPG
ncbi:sensor histidine kinase [Streptomyces sp. NPDC004435]|uniref:sensor histidine kinase n=1 Tax=Streptomyces sp. NPDC004435 TaxID=3364701 RepID=UPI0036A87B85